MGEIFEYKSTVTVGDTNLLQNVYFSNYFKLQGIAREIWFHESIDDGFSSFSNGLLVVTRSAECSYYKDFFLTDKILVKLQVLEIGKASVDLLFSFYCEKTMELHAVGKQKLVFVDNNHKICRMPREFKMKASKFLIEN